MKCNYNPLYLNYGDTYTVLHNITLCGQTRSLATHRESTLAHSNAENNLISRRYNHLNREKHLAMVANKWGTEIRFTTLRMICFGRILTPWLTSATPHALKYQFPLTGQVDAILISTVSSKSQEMDNNTIMYTLKCALYCLWMTQA